MTAILNAMVDVSSPDGLIYEKGMPYEIRDDDAPEFNHMQYTVFHTMTGECLSVFGMDSLIRVFGEKQIFAAIMQGNLIK